MHPVISRLSAANRSALLGHPLYVKLPEPRRAQLLDEVLKVRESLDNDDKLDAFSDAKERDADAKKLKAGLTMALTVLGRHRQINADLIEGLAGYHRGFIDSAMYEKRACMETLRRMLRVLDGLPAELDPFVAVPFRPFWLNLDELSEPNDPLEYPLRPRDNREAGLLYLVLKDFDMTVSRSTADAERHDSGLAFLGLLADPVASGEAMRKRLRR
jgi:hypothetical protein